MRFLSYAHYIPCVTQDSAELSSQETPTAYIMWRFAGNDDRESLEFKTDELSVDEERANREMELNSFKWFYNHIVHLSYRSYMSIYSYLLIAICLL